MNLVAFRPPLLAARRLLALAAVLLLGACGTGDAPIRIGLAGPFRDPIGAPMLRAAELAVDEINAAGGIRGRRLELVARDDHGDTDSAVAVAAALRNSDVVAVVGHLFSGTTLAAAPVYNGGRDAVVAITPSSSSPDISTAGDWTFRICPSDHEHGEALAAWARERLGLERGTVFYLNDAYGRGVRQTFVAEFRRRRGSVRAINPYLGDAPDVGPYLDRLSRDGRSQFIMVAGNRAEAEAILRQADARGIDLPLLGGDGLEGIEESGALAEGTYLTAAYLPMVDTPENRRFVATWTRRFPTAGLPNQPAAGTYDAIHLLTEVIAEAGTDREAVRRALAARDAARPFDGVTGRIAFDSLGDAPNQHVHVALVRNGRVEPAEEH